ncbi:MBL fold metallo-hydrolase [Ethanoligenens harbinense]|uniref:MBL fold metallo-hydrolase n=1 Tax=Ethanoligenens harbinense TaxID=253239 RepID=UPI000EA384BB|nr:MBL fold metallo-hydrolase [Ethanoligenens harbinense]AYF41770.1 hypothetical protein CN246_09110 [Ethanoligenens harbinense]
MTLTILGCWGGFPRPGGATSGYLISHGLYHVLIDCGSGVVSRLSQHIEIKRLNAVFLSHYHYDHFCDVGVLQYARMVHSQIGERMGCLPIYAPACDRGCFSSLAMPPYTQGIAYQNGGSVRVGPLTVTFFRSSHPLECYAMRIQVDNKTIFYTADTAYSEHLVQAARGCDLLIAESSLYPGHDGTEVGHMTSEQAAKMAHCAGAKELILSHLPAYGHVQFLLQGISDQYDGPVALATEGLIRKL